MTAGEKISLQRYTDRTSIWYWLEDWRRAYCAPRDHPWRRRQPSSFDSEGSRESRAQCTREIYDDWSLIFEPFLRRLSLVRIWSYRLARLRPRSWGNAAFAVH